MSLSVHNPGAHAEMTALREESQRHFEHHARVREEMENTIASLQLSIAAEAASVKRTCELLDKQSDSHRDSLERNSVIITSLQSALSSAIKGAEAAYGRQSEIQAVAAEKEQVLQLTVLDLRLQLDLAKDNLALLKSSLWVRLGKKLHLI